MQGEEGKAGAPLENKPMILRPLTLACPLLGWAGWGGRSHLSGDLPLKNEEDHSGLRRAVEKTQLDLRIQHLFIEHLLRVRYSSSFW